MLNLWFSYLFWLNTKTFPAKFAVFLFFNFIYYLLTKYVFLKNIKTGMNNTNNNANTFSVQAYKIDTLFSIIVC